MSQVESESGRSVTKKVNHFLADVTIRLLPVFFTLGVNVSKMCVGISELIYIFPSVSCKTTKRSL